MVTPMLDLVGFRAQFPVLTDTVYLASCSQGALSTDLDTALAEFRYLMRDRGAPWAEWTDKVEEARERFARLIGAEPEDIAVVPNASVGAYQAASTRDYSARPVIVTSDMEFPSISHVWHAQQGRGAVVRMVSERDGLVDLQEYLDAIDERTALVSVPLVSYRNGLRLPVAEVTARAREVGARVFVDVYQGAGVLPVDVGSLDCDFLVSGSLKFLLGVSGIAFLYVRPGVADEVPPQLTGWFGRTNPFAFDPRTLDFPETARRYDTGTPAILSAYGANAGMGLLERLDPAAAHAHVASLVDDLSARLVDAGERLWSPADPALRGPIVALVDDDPEALAGWLATRRIVTSPRGRVLRLALHAYNDESDLDTVCAALKEYRAG